MKDAHAYRGVHINYDHNLVMIKVQLRLKRPRQEIRKITWKSEVLREIQLEFNAEIFNLMKMAKRNVYALVVMRKALNGIDEGVIVGGN